MCNPIEKVNIYKKIVLTKWKYHMVRIYVCYIPYSLFQNKFVCRTLHDKCSLPINFPEYSEISQKAFVGPG